MESGKYISHHYLEDQIAEMEKLRLQIKLLEEGKFDAMPNSFSQSWHPSRIEISTPKATSIASIIAEAPKTNRSAIVTLRNRIHEMEKQKKLKPEKKPNILEPSQEHLSYHMVLNPLEASL